MMTTETMKKAAPWIGAFLALTVALSGGSSRPDAVMLAILRPLMAATLSVLLVLPPGRWSIGARLPLVGLGVLALLIASQLIPLPPAIWSRLPQGDLVGRSADFAGMPQPWRPLSLNPMLTLNSLFALLIPCAGLVAVSRIDSGRFDRIGLVIIALAILSALFGIMQFVGGPDSAAYLYGRNFENTPDGLFSNRNHQAAFLAASLPFLAAWAAEPRRELRRRQQCYVLAAMVTMLLVLVLLATASRSGLVIVGPIVCLAFILITGPVVIVHRLRRWIIAAVGAAVVGISILAVMFDRARGIARFAELGDPSQEMRYRALPTLQILIQEYLPFGSGFGSFDTVFRRAEPDALLNPAYFNNAHNDYVELIITAGVPGIALELVFLAWFVLRGWQLLRDRASGPERNWGVAAMLLILAFLLGSITDYPLRTPIIAFSFVLSCAVVELDAARRAKLLRVGPSKSRRSYRGGAYE